MATNAQVAFQAAAVKLEQIREVDLTERVDAFYTWLQANDVPVARVVHDGVTATDTSLVSATAAFTARDVGATVAGAGITAGTKIQSVTNATTVVLDTATTATANNVDVTITDVATATSVGDAQAALLGAAHAYDSREGQDPTGDVTAHATQLLADIAAHAVGNSS